MLAAFLHFKKGGATMNNQEVKGPKRKTIMVQGHQATLCFVEHPNPKVAEQVYEIKFSGMTGE